ncbi:MAG: SpoIVB peptidase [Clostridia bacterium]|nr:SpoIVB peptidase [Clostridia bacterium]
MRRICRWTAGALTPLCLALLAWMGWAASALPDSFRATDEKAWTLSGGLIEAVTVSGGQTVTASAGDADLSEVQLRLFGVFPVKNATVRHTPSRTVVLCGTPFGIKAYTDGVLVVGLTAVDSGTGSRLPAQAAGIKIGDVVLSVDGKSVTTNEQLADRIAEGGGRPQSFRVRRDGVEFTARVTAVWSASDNAYKTGMWVRDSAAGIGTLTFYDESTGVLAGLGHAICDVDTEQPIPISGGELVPAYIFGVTRGQVGDAGELRGCFTDGTLGSLLVNVDSGIYGRSDAAPGQGDRVEVAMKQQAEVGPAKVYTTVSGDTPAWYDVEVTRIRYTDASPTRHMVIRITDPKLLKATGGIVQGMSGSPLVQNGRLIGAVTHVLVNDPTQGYAIFAENMLKTAQSAESEAQKAS